MNHTVILPVVEHALNQGVCVASRNVICYSDEHNGGNRESETVEMHIF